MRAERAWLLRPFVHRGLHDESRGIIENSVSAIEAAIVKGYGIEVDLQRSADHLPVVFHDRTLNRLTEETGPLAARTGADLCKIFLRNSSDRILGLSDLLALVAGRVPVLLELKSDWSGDRRFEANIARLLSGYDGHVAVMSFDPHAIGAFRTLAPELTRGLVAENFSEAKEWPELSALQRLCFRHLLHAALAWPHFIAYDVAALPAPGPLIARHIFGLPLLTWTVRNEADRARARRWADAMIFEGIAP